MNKEMWKDIVGYENLYQISNLGRVKSLEKIINHYNGYGYYNHKLPEKILKPVNRNGYGRVQLKKNGVGKSYSVHKLVAEAFIPNPENKPQVNHKDGNKLNNCVDNLEWCTCSENVKHAFKIGLSKHNEKQKELAKKYANLNFNLEKKRRKVYQYDLQGNFIKEWDCLLNIEKKLNIKYQSICACCKNKRSTAGGYIWRYKDAQ